MTTPDSPAERGTDAPVEPLSDQQLRHLRIFLDCNVAAIKSGTVRALIARLDAAETALDKALGVPFASSDIMPITRAEFERIAELEDVSITFHGHDAEECAGEWCPQHPAKGADDA